MRGFRDQVLDSLGALDGAVIKEALTDRLDEAGVSASQLEEILAAAPESLRAGFREALQSGDLQGLLDVSEEIDAAAESINTNFVAQGSSLTPGQQAVLDLNKALGGTAGELFDGVTEAQSLARVLGNDVPDSADTADEAIDDATRDRDTDVTVNVKAAAAAATLAALASPLTKPITIRMEEHAATGRRRVRRPHPRKATTMTTLTLVADPARSRVQVIVTGLGADAPATVYRTEPGGTAQPVRGGVAVAGDGVVLDDYEAPLGVVLTYSVAPDATGTAVASDTITLDGTVLGPILIHPTDPTRNLPVTLVDDTPVTAVAPGTVHHVLGADLPLVTYTRRNDVRRSITLWTPYSGKRAVFDATADGSPMLLKVPAGCPGVTGWRWLETIVAEKRRGDVTGRSGVDVTIDAVDIATPAGFITTDPGNSWAAVEQFTPPGTWQAVKDTYSTWADVRLARFPGR